MHDIAIVPATPAMADQIAAILVETGWFEAVQHARVEEVLACANRDSRSVLIAQDMDGNVIGYVAYHRIPYLFLAADEAYVSELFVREGQRGKGVGSALLDAAVRDACGNGVARMMLITGRNRESYRRGFYQKKGWREREEMANFVVSCQGIRENAGRGLTASSGS